MTVLLLGAAAIFAVPVPQCEETPPAPEPAPQATKTWTIVMRFKDAAGEPPVRIYLVIKNDTEGGAAIEASKFLYEKLQPGPFGNLVYVEAQRKE